MLLFRRRHKLFGDAKDPFVATTQSAYGFLYMAYGPTAWWWEVEELIRKLLLSAVVVLIEPGSPLQVHAASVACMLKNYEGGWGVVWGFINCGRGGVVIVA